jgi:hypothetical protein
MIHIKKFMDKMSVVETKMNKDVVLPILDARGLRDDIARLLADLHELSINNNNKNDVIDIQIKGSSF